MTPSEFKTRFPEFTAEDDARVQLFIDNAAPFFDVERWDDLYSEGVANYVAHKLTMDRLRLVASGRLADTTLSSKVGELAWTKSEAALLLKMRDPFQSTDYGQEYRRLMKLVGAGGLSV